MKKNNKTLFKAILPWVIVLLLLSSLFPFLLNNGGSKELTYSQFMTVVKDKKITNVTITPNSFVTKVEGSYKKNSKGDKVNFTTIVPKTDKEFNVVVEMLQSESKQLVTDLPYDIPDYEGVNGVSEKNYNRSQEEKSRYKIINPQDLSLSELMQQDELFESPFEEEDK